MKYIVTIKEILEMPQDSYYKVAIYEQVIETEYESFVADIIKAANLMN